MIVWSSEASLAKSRNQSPPWGSPAARETLQKPPMKRVIVAVVAALFPVLAGAQEVTPLSSVVAQPPTKLPRTHTPEPTSADINVKDLMTRLYLFADDSMLGREAGKVGNAKGTDYIAREAMRLGLRPAGDNGGYFQTIPFGTLGTDSASALSVGGAALQFGTEWGGSAVKDVSFANAPVVYGGNLADSTSLLPFDQVKGKFVVLSLPAALSFPMFRTIRTYAASGASAVGTLVNPRFPLVARPAEMLNDIPPGAPLLAPQAFISAQSISKFFDAPLTELKAGDAGKNASLDLRVKFTPAANPARNVVAILPGGDPKLSGEYVAIGAHNDHVGFSTRPVDHDSIRIFNHIVRPGGAENPVAQANAEQQAEVNKELADWRAAHPNASRPDSIFNGADDDGTGSVSVLEIAEKLASLKGKDRAQTLGAVRLARRRGEGPVRLARTSPTIPTVPRDSIVAQLNMDMVGRGEASGRDRPDKGRSTNSRRPQLSPARRLTPFVDGAGRPRREGEHAGQPRPFTFDYSIDANGHPANIYCRSDHFSYARYGIPIMFFTTGVHCDYHQVTDEPEYIDYEHMARVRPVHRGRRASRGQPRSSRRG